MKKRSLSTLQLNKKSISNFKVIFIKGGKLYTENQGWQTCVVTRCHHH